MDFSAGFAEAYQDIGQREYFCFHDYEYQLGVTYVFSVLSLGIVGKYPAQVGSLIFLQILAVLKPSYQPC